MPAATSSLTNAGLRTSSVTGPGKQPFGREDRKRILRRIFQKFSG